MPMDLPTKVKNLSENSKIINVSASSDGIDFMDGLALLFIGLKLTDHLQNWTWVEVTAPLWAPFMFSWFVRLFKSTFMNDGDEGEE
jgi:hypothetical protein